MSVAEPLGGIAYRLYTAFVEGDRIEMADLLDLVCDVQRVAHKLDTIPDAGVHLVQHRLVGDRMSTVKTVWPAMMLREFG